jgi:outer membrane protein OmpA-like peptidoglycan-associated protein
MKTITNLKTGSHLARSSYGRFIKSLFSGVLIFTGLHAPIQAQDKQAVARATPQVIDRAQTNSTMELIPEYDTIKYSQPNWWFGAAAGANFNFYRGTTQQLSEDLIVPAAFRHGNGVGLYVAGLAEFHRPDSKWGGLLQVGYDGRNGTFSQMLTPCNCPIDLSTNIGYVTVEPSIRFAPFKSNFYLFGGPRLAFNVGNSFTYKLGLNPDVPEQAPTPDVKGNFSNVNNVLISMQIGAGYDIQLSSAEKQWKTVLSPFASFHPYFGQDPRSSEPWTVTTVRVGAALKFGRGKRIKTEKTVVPIPDVEFSITSPENIPVERRVREAFPIRNYVFFNVGSTEIPDRYVLISKADVKNFKEDRLEKFTPYGSSARSDRQMTVYYNVLNILGDRMRRNPRATVMLTGASLEGEKDGLAMAGSIKQYLVNVFGIAPARINTEGRIKPKDASEQPGATKELILVREEDRRVSIWSESSDILQQYQTGSNTTLASVDIDALETAPVDSYITFNAPGAEQAFNSWKIEIKDEVGKMQYFGHYSYMQEKVMIRGKSILGTRTKGDFKVTMTGETKHGKTVRKDASLHLELWTPPKDEMGKRFSVIYEFNDANTSIAYQKYLTDVVSPNIPTGATVLIRGYTDVVGDAAYNKKLSLDRANDVRRILEKSMANAGRTDVTFESYGFGEDETLARYENNYPEGRFYNRGVTVDVIPKH